MSPIPPKLKQQMAADPWYKRCCITGRTEDIEWHHAHQFSGRQTQEYWCIVPLNKEVHKNIRSWRTEREMVDIIILCRADEATLKKYSKAENLVFKRDYLLKKYGKTREEVLSKISRNITIWRPEIRPRF
jgi:hypothetical protein